jgi:hypothetical protein
MSSLSSVGRRKREADDEDKVSRKKLSSSLAQTHSRDIRYLCQ